MTTSAPASPVTSARGATDAAARVAAPAAEAVGRAQEIAQEQTHPTHVALLRGRAGLVVAVVAFCGFVGIFALVRARRSEEIDVAITLRLQARKHPWVARLMELVSWPGFPPQSRVIPPTMIVAMWLLRFRVEAAFQLLAWGTGGLSTVLKAIMKRPRPLPEQVRVVVAPLGGSSFPSGHVITYAGTYGFAAYLAHALIRPDAVRRPVVVGLVGLVGLVGPSRIYQGHHWPTDVSASYLLGLSYLIGLTALYRSARRRWPANERGRFRAWFR